MVWVDCRRTEGGMQQPWRTGWREPPSESEAIGNGYVPSGAHATPFAGLTPPLGGSVHKIVSVPLSPGTPVMLWLIRWALWVPIRVLLWLRYWFTVRGK